MLICGKVINSVGYAKSGGGYKYKVKIRKANGRDTTFITSKEVFKKCEYYKDIVFDADIAYKKNGNIDGKILMLMEFMLQERILVRKIIKTNT